MLAAAALAGCGGTEGAATAPPDVVPVVEVVDGDTIRVELDGRVQPVRVIGIDTPEPYREGDPQPCSREASARMGELAGDEVTLLADAEDRDRYDRLLRYVEADGLDVGAQLVLEGLARPLRIAPNIARARDYEQLARTAERERLGVHGGPCSRRTG